MVALSMSRFSAMVLPPILPGATSSRGIIASEPHRNWGAQPPRHFRNPWDTYQSYGLLTRDRARV